MKAWSIAGAVLGVALGMAFEAEACGGCFGPPPSGEPSIVTGHRMAFAVSASRTVLWDQFEYSGEPEDFSWVLPVQPGAFIEVAEPAFLAALDEFTQPLVYSPPTSCGGGGGCTCLLGGFASADSGGFYSPPNVQVVSRETVGPYDSVVLRSSDGDSLRAWLVQNGYVLPADVEPIVDGYVAEGFDFLALRLSPGKGVDQMEPVRVTTPGGAPKLPLKMVAAGVGESVSLTLFVLGAGRHAISDLVDFEVQAEELTFDFSTGKNDYAEVVGELFRKVSGRVQVTGYAMDFPFTTVRSSPFGYPAQYVTEAGASAVELEDLYFRKAAEDADLASSGELDRCVDALRPYDAAMRVVARCGDAPCPSPFKWTQPSSSDIDLGAAGPGGQGGSAGQAQAGAGQGQGGAGQSLGGAGGGAGGTVAAAPVFPSGSSGHFVCGPFTDIEAAMIGQIPKDLWLTRLDMNLPREALNMDCEVQPTGGKKVSGTFTAGKLENDPCASAAPPLPPRDPRRAVPPALALLLALSLGLRRWAKKWRSPLVLG